MFVKLHHKSLAGCLTLLLAGMGGTTLAADMRPSIDMGVATSSQPVHVTLLLKLRNETALQDYIRQTITPGSAHYRQFLSTSEFASQYGASDADIARVQAFLQQHGLSGQLLASHLAIETSGTLAQFGAIFQAPIHDYVSAASGRHFHRPATAPQMPTALADSVVAVSGLSNERQFLSHRIHAPQLPAAPQRTLTLQALSKSTSGNPTATGQPGDYTVGDVADLYDINPLYQHGITGKGSTVAIVTLSNFYPADAQTYWSTIGLATKPNRITQVHVDGGGAIDGGSGETALDVEQSGGIAPYANIIVYDAPNAGNGFIDAFAQAVADNKADSISTSWGAPEIYNFAALNVNGAKDTDTTDVGDLRAFHQILLEAAVQGQSVFAAAGDSGAYDTVRGLGTGTGPGQYSAPLTVDSPASDPYITAAGGTTVPVKFVNSAGQVVLSINQESVWGWDYLLPFVSSRADVFSVGGGGGVSVYWQQPLYQAFTRGTRRSEKQQSLVYNDPDAGPTTLLKLPANFGGRNVPDIALNADPETGYVVVSTTDGGVISEGGTSFVAPQLNGISALLAQSTGHRVGFWNPQVYLLQNIFGYGPWSAFNSVRAGDNWFYYGAPNYTPGAGIGTLDVANLNLFLGGR
ncbi:protease pro-enzyme activation domain-containing protein [Rhodanobacter sp. Si-c]|uniref:Protease pro-enzyme activation domain-containing protein n=1 Tax=Rhodanobacter lycopersici TaxID=3162487 RepID=A0ABV3QG27_9GAMM